jgi:hypothetical protein
MLGYVQVRSVADWSGDLRSALNTNRVRHEVSSSEPLTSANLGAELVSTWLSEHRRPTVGRPIAIYHSLLLFHGGWTAPPQADSI